MKIWIDADACPGPVKHTVCRASRRTGLAVTLVANRPLIPSPGLRIDAVRVGQGIDEADDYLLRHAFASALDRWVAQNVSSRSRPNN